MQVDNTVVFCTQPWRLRGSEKLLINCVQCEYGCVCACVCVCVCNTIVCTCYCSHISLNLTFLGGFAWVQWWRHWGTVQHKVQPLSAEDFLQQHTKLYQMDITHIRTSHGTNSGFNIIHLRRSTCSSAGLRNKSSWRAMDNDVL